MCRSHLYQRSIYCTTVPVHFGGSVHWPLAVQAISEAPSLSYPAAQLYATVVPTSADLFTIHILFPLLITGGTPQSMVTVDMQVTFGRHTPSHQHTL